MRDVSHMSSTCTRVQMSDDEHVVCTHKRLREVTEPSVYKIPGLLLHITDALYAEYMPVIPLHEVIRDYADYRAECKRSDVAEGLVKDATAVYASNGVVLTCKSNGSTHCSTIDGIEIYRGEHLSSSDNHGRVTAMCVVPNDRTRMYVAYGASIWHIRNGVSCYFKGIYTSDRGIHIKFTCITSLACSEDGQMVLASEHEHALIAEINADDADNTYTHKLPVGYTGATVTIDRDVSESDDFAYYYSPSRRLYRVTPDASKDKRTEVEIPYRDFTCGVNTDLLIASTRNGLIIGCDVWCNTRLQYAVYLIDPKKRMMYLLKADCAFGTVLKELGDNGTSIHSGLVDIEAGASDSEPYVSMYLGSFGVHRITLPPECHDDAVWILDPTCSEGSSPDTDDSRPPSKKQRP